jgi:hypothetical protein
MERRTLRNLAQVEPLVVTAVPSARTATPTVDHSTAGNVNAIVNQEATRPESSQSISAMELEHTTGVAISRISMTLTSHQLTMNRRKEEKKLEKIQLLLHPSKRNLRK